MIPRVSDSEEPSGRPSIQVVTTRATPTWAKLFSFAVIANAGGIAVSVWVARLIRNVPATDSAEQWLRIAGFTVVAIAALFDALLLDELVFDGAFRRTHITGRLPGAARRDEDVEGVAVSMQRSTWSFPALLLSAGLVTSMAFNFVTHDVDGYYKHIGIYLGALERGDGPRQIEAVKQLSIRRAPEVLPALRVALAKGGEAAPWAAWAIGRHRDVQNRRPLVPPLVAAVRTGDDATRREAAIALGRLQQRSMVVALQDEVTADLAGGGPVDPRLLFALGSVQVLSSREVLGEVLQRGDALAQRVAAWAIAQHRDQRGAKELVNVLEDRLPTADVELRCAIVHALGIFAHEQSNLALVRTYDNSTDAELAFVCPRIRIFMSPDGQDDAEEILLPEDTLALEILMSMGQMRATTPEVRKVVEPWLERRTQDADVTAFVREGARAVLTGIREGRDDRTKPSVDEVFGRK